MASEEAVGRAQLQELKQVARTKDGDIVMIPVYDPSLTFSKNLVEFLRLA